MRRFSGYLLGCLSALILFYGTAEALICTWNSATNVSWATGTWAPSAPGVNDTARFDGTQTTNCTIDAAINVKRIEITSDYTGTIAQNNGVSLTIGLGGFSMAGGVYSGGNADMTLSGTLTLSGGAFTAPSGTLYLNGPSQAVSGTYNTLIMSGGNFLHNSGTLAITPSTAYNGFTKFNLDIPSKLQLWNLKFGGTGSGSSDDEVFVELTASDTLVVNGNLVYQTASQLEYLYVNNGVIDFLGDSVLCSSGNGGTTKLLIHGNKNQYYKSTGFMLPSVEVRNGTFAFLPASGTTNLGVSFLNIENGTFAAPTGTLSISGIPMNVGASGSYDALKVTGTLIHNNGTIRVSPRTGGNGTLTFRMDVPSKIDLNNFVLGGNGTSMGGEIIYYTLPAGDTLRILGNLLLTRTSSYLEGLQINGGVFEVQGSLTDSFCTLPSTTAMLISGARDTQIIRSTSNLPTGTWTVNKSSGTLVLGSNVSFPGALAVVSGILDQGASNALTLGGALTLSSGATWRDTGTGAITLGGNVVNNGTVILASHGTGCKPDSILVRSSSSGTQRTWSGSGTFTVANVDVKDQAGSASIVALSSTNSGNMGSNWTVRSNCTSAPDNVRDLAASSVTANGFTLNWTKPDSAFALMTYIVLRQGSTFPTGKTDPNAYRVDSVAATTTSLVVTSLPDTTQFSIGLFVRNSDMDFSAITSGSQTTATTLNSAPANPLSYSYNSSTASSISYQINNGNQLASDVGKIFVWISSNKNDLLSKAASNVDSLLKADLSSIQTRNNLSASTKYYIGIIPRDNFGLWSDSMLLDSVSTLITNPLTLNLSFDAEKEEIYVKFSKTNSVSSSVDHLYLYYKTTGFVTNPSTQPDTALTLAQLQSLPNSTLTLKPSIKGTYYFSSTLGIGSTRSAIVSPKDSIRIDFTKPLNPFTISFYDSDSLFINDFYLVDTALGTAAEDSLIDSVVILVATDSAQLAQGYKSTPSYHYASLFKNQVRTGKTIWPFYNLTEGTCYYFGLATRNRIGNWSQTISISGRCTKFNNPLGLEISETAVKGDSSLIIHFLNVDSTNPAADTIKLFFQPAPGTYPTAANEAPKKAYSRSALRLNSYDTIPAFQSRRLYYFSVSCGNSRTGFAVINIPRNCKAFETGNYSAPPNRLQFTSIVAAQDSIGFSFNGNIADSDGVDSVYIYISTDTATLKSGYTASVTPRIIIPKSGATGSFSIRPLTKGVPYYLGVALKSTELFWSTLTIHSSAVTIPKVNVVTHAEISAQFKSETKLWSVTVKDTTPSELARVIWGSSFLSPADSADYGVPGSTTSFQFTCDSLFLRLRDPLGSTRDTILRDFLEQKIKIAQGTDYFDFSKLAVTTGSTSLQSAIMKSGKALLWVGKSTLSASDSQKLAALGFNNQLPFKYSMMNEMEGQFQGDSAIYNTGVTLSYSFDTAGFAFTKDLRFYRLIYVDTIPYLEYLGGSAIIDSSGKGVITLTNFKIDTLAHPVTWIICADPQIPALDYNASSLALDTNALSARLVFSASDNTVNMRAGIRLFTYGRSGDYIKLYDTTIVRLKPRNNIPATTVICTLDVSGDIALRKANVWKSGVFAALFVSDGRSRFFYANQLPAQTVIADTFNLVQKSWKIISIPWTTSSSSEELLIVNQITNFSGAYDISRERIYGEPGTENAFPEFNASSSAFNIKPSRAFLVNVRYGTDVNLNYALNNPALAAPVKSRGYEYSQPGWRLISLPFNGQINLDAVIRSSKSSHTTGPVNDPANWQNRIWKLTQKSDLSTVFEKLTSTQDLLPNAREGFLAYLYDGDTLVFPILKDTAFLPPRPGSTAKQNLEKSVTWRLNASLKTSGNSASLLDNFNWFGTDASDELILRDIRMPGSTCEFGFENCAGLACTELRRSNKSGEAFTLLLKTEASTRNQDLELTLSELSTLPANYQVILEDPSLKYSSDLRASGGKYSFYTGNESSRRLRVLVGSEEYIKANAQQSIPIDYGLEQNLPNPFNPRTIIRFSVPGRSDIGTGASRLRLDIFNLQGRCINVLLDQPAYPGHYIKEWNGKNRDGKSMASGLYFYRLTIQDEKGRICFTSTRNMILAK